MEDRPAVGEHRALHGPGASPPAPLPLPLRNRLAELILDAFDSGEARTIISALARTLTEPGSRLEPADADRLVALGWFERVAPGRVRLMGAFRAHGPALADRVTRATAALRASEPPEEIGLAALLDRAAALANAGLFFEVHELLEPAWFQAADPTRTALQGLIQVAVGFHHLENGNLAGARSLLADGVAKVAGSGGALPVDTSAWLEALRAALGSLAAGGVATPPVWPRPRRDGEA